jgi:NitT/TauT family transport system substrate-binding protein
MARLAMRWCAVTMLLAMPLASARALDTVKYGLSWLPQGEHCGFFQARDAGLYAKHGLAVELVPGGPGINMSLLVAGGKVDFAMGSSFTTLNMAAKDIPGVTVAAMFQKNPQTLVAHPDPSLRTLTDLKGRPIMVAQFSRNEFWQFLRARYGFTDDQLRPYTYSSAAFLADPKAVQQGYVTEDAFFLGKELGAPPTIFLLADYGYSAYATTIYTMRATIARDRTLVQRFVDASIEGYRACLKGDSAAARAAITAANPEHSGELFDFKLKQMAAFGLVDGGDAATGGIGTMTATRWQEFFTTMVEAGVYDPKVDWRQAFTLDFVATPRR